MDRGGEDDHGPGGGSQVADREQRDQIGAECGEEDEEEARRDPGDVAAVSRDERGVGPPGESAGHGEEGEYDDTRRYRDGSSHGCFVVSARAVLFVVVPAFFVVPSAVSVVSVVSVVGAT